MGMKRIYLILWGFILFLVVLGFKILGYQLFFSESYAKTASTQRVITTLLQKSRGDILDRNGIPFTNRSETLLCVIKSAYFKDSHKDLYVISEILGLEEASLVKEVQNSSKPLVYPCTDLQFKELKEQEIQGVSLVHGLNRYDENSVARHVLGYLEEKDRIGKVNIEKTYESILKSDKEISVEVITDALKKPLKGLGYRMIRSNSEKETVSLTLTLDYHIQKITEEVMRRYGLNGAVVVEEVSNGDIVAIASMPDFNQNRVENFLNSPQKELFNKAVAAYNIGSVFKIIGTAAMLEAGMDPDLKYNCQGAIEIGSKSLKCSSFYKGGHGEVDLTSAFSQSCNPYFIHFGVELGSKELLKMADRFGLGKITGIKHQGIDEATGYLPDFRKNYGDGDIANLSIGQGDIMATPLQVADVVATVANGGIKNKVNMVKYITNSRGEIVKNLREKAGERIISKTTADKIKSLMEEAVIHGTGTKADIPLYGGAAGKTGSAETGQCIEDEMVVQAWFAGYFPRWNPKYAMAVFIENGKMGGQAAAPIFKEIAEEIMKKGF